MATQQAVENGARCAGPFDLDVGLPLGYYTSSDSKTKLDNALVQLNGGSGDILSFSLDMLVVTDPETAGLHQIGSIEISRKPNSVKIHVDDTEKCPQELMELTKYDDLEISLGSHCNVAIVRRGIEIGFKRDFIWIYESNKPWRTLGVYRLPLS